VSETAPVPARRALDPRTTLAVSVHSQPGVYALLLGSGASTAVGVPTGWGVVQQLIDRVRVAAGESVADGDAIDPELWWSEHGDGQPLGYSNLLHSLAPTPGARRAHLASFFEPTEDEREAGIKCLDPHIRPSPSWCAAGPRESS
jgi:hypothetical protein